MSPPADRVDPQVPGTPVGQYYEEYWSDKGDNPLHSRGSQMPDHVLEMFDAAAIGQSTDSLDVGCGAGGPYARWLSTHARSYVGVDISENAVTAARRAGLDARLIVDATSLPLPDESVDVATCIEVLEHLFLPQLAVREILRVLRPGGRLIATVPNVAYWRRRVDLGALGRWNPMGDLLSVSEPWRDPHLRFFTVNTFQRMLTGAGFAEVCVSAGGGAFLSDVPGLRGIARGRGSRMYRRAERVMPSLLGARLVALARKG